jgi:hypothetical protein
MKAPMRREFSSIAAAEHPARASVSSSLGGAVARGSGPVAEGKVSRMKTDHDESDVQKEKIENNKSEAETAKRATTDPKLTGAEKTPRSGIVTDEAGDAPTG